MGPGTKAFPRDEHFRSAVRRLQHDGWADSAAWLMARGAVSAAADASSAASRGDSAAFQAFADEADALTARAQAVLDEWTRTHPGRAK